MEKIIEIKNVSKHFGGITALNNVSFDIYKGEVHGLVGKNGAGKSTLIKILTGNLLSDSGNILLDGEEIRFKSVSESLSRGIKAVYQDYQVCENLNVWQNIFLYEKENPLKFVNRKSKIKKCEDFLRQFNLNLGPKTLLEDLSSAGKQLVSIAKAIVTKEGEVIKVLVLDEPTATLSQAEKEVLFDTISVFKKKGITVIFVSHIIKDVIDISERISVLRDSNYIDTLEDNITEEIVIDKMVGKKAGKYVGMHEKEKDTHKEIFRAENIITDKIKIENFNVRENEIVGLAGLEGCGASELMRAISGVQKKKNGIFYMQGKKIDIENVIDSVNNKIIYIPSEKSECLMENFSILKNLITLNIKEFLKHGFLKDRTIRNYSTEQIKEFSIKIGNLLDNIGSLSGGNQRKVIVSKFLSVNPMLLMMDDNTKGIDINAKYELYGFLKKNP